MKTIPAVIFAVLITAVIGVVMFMIGANALLNKNSVPISNSPNTTTTNVSAAVSTQDQQTIQQMQNLINQYQARDKQYQSELNDAAQRLSQANQQLDQTNQQLETYVQLINELQNFGVIRITNDGRVLIRGGSGNGGG
jgi:cell shape-determining protein MreC